MPVVAWNVYAPLADGRIELDLDIRDLLVALAHVRKLIEERLRIFALYPCKRIRIQKEEMGTIYVEAFST